ncbi:MAG: hypothetical protein LC637_12940 [Xanthomonadaceae bacterium]|nr:hypothetical protein [Xanthomonadaceae bacterium]
MRSPPRNDLGLPADMPLKLVEQDFDGDASVDRLVYFPGEQQLIVQLSDTSGQFRTLKVVDGMDDLAALRSLMIRTDNQGNTSVELTVVC